MTCIRTTIAPSGDFPPELLKRLFAFRHRVFVERLGWVPARGQEEVDFFDTVGPVHAICQDPDGEIIAAARLLPMSGPSMLRDVFPSLLGDVQCPDDDQTWEISRFALRPVRGTRMGHRRVLLSLVSELFDFAQSRGVRHLLAVSDQRLERMVIDATGLSIRRLAPPQRIGSDWAVAGCTEVTDGARCLLMAEARSGGRTPSNRAAA